MQSGLGGAGEGGATKKGKGKQAKGKGKASAAGGKKVLLFLTLDTAVSSCNVILCRLGFEEKHVLFPV